MKALKCDRCGKYFDEPDDKKRTLSLSGRCSFNNFLGQREVTDYENIDLCDECYESLVAWLNTEEAEAEDDRPSNTEK